MHPSNQTVPMQKNRLAVLATAALLVFGPANAAAPARPSIEQLAAFPQYSSFTLSPDGQHIAARNPSKPLQAGPISDVGRGTPTFIRIG